MSHREDNCGRCFRRRSVWLAVMVAASLCSAPAGARSEDRPSDRPDDLGERLIHKATTGAEEDPMDAVMRVMANSAERLSIEFDPGDKTQAMQADITAKLDELIAEAAARQKAGAKVKRMPAGDKRRKATDKKKEPAKADQPQQPGDDNTPPQRSTVTDQAVDNAQTGPGMQDARRAWGHLPMRDRDEMVQGLREESLEQYRAWVEAYFKALQDTADDN